MNKLNKAQRLVMAAYNANPAVVDTEIMLLEAIWKIEGWDESKSLYWNLSRVSHPESLSRARRRLHELGLISYSKDAENARYDAYTKDTERYGKDITPKVVAPKVTVKLIDGELVTVME